MIDCLVVGRPNVGKTCFVINFAEYLGLSELKLSIRQTRGFSVDRHYGLDEARTELISSRENHTRQLQCLSLTFSRRKLTRKLQLIDSCGLRDCLESESALRQAMALTISKIGSSRLVLHMVDVRHLYLEDKPLSGIDRLIFRYAGLEDNYALLVNKIDLPGYGQRILQLKTAIKTPIFPISALNSQGFKPVKELVLSYV